MKSKSGVHRLEYLDWLRGIGATIMLHGHVWDSFLRDDLRNRGVHAPLLSKGGRKSAVCGVTQPALLVLLDEASKRLEQP